MSAFVQLLQNQPFTLIVSLPDNSASLAQAAIEGGADVLKVHINVDHRASGRSFGTLRENLNMFKQVIDHFKGPVGIVPGDHLAKVKGDELEELEQLGFDFISIYAEHAPAWILKGNGMGKMIALSHVYSPDVIKHISSLSVDVVEASIVPGDQYGMPLSVNDLFKYKQIAECTAKPVIVPSQKKIEIDDLEQLMQAGVKGVMIGAVVTGQRPETIYRATQAFRSAIDALT